MTTFGEALVQELLWIHDVIRRDLVIVRELAAEVAAGAAPEAVREQLRELETQGPLWQLKHGCLHYCRHVHGHHSFEDEAWFPGLRHANADLVPVVDVLEADHRRIADLLDAVERAADELLPHGPTEQRDALRIALDQLADSLIEHLEFEEAAITPTLLTLTVPPWMIPQPE